MEVVVLAGRAVGSRFGAGLAISGAGSGNARNVHKTVSQRTDAGFIVAEIDEAEVAR